MSNVVITDEQFTESDFTLREFVGFPKIPRLRRGILITEKIDGTNACVVIGEDDIYAQSRTRIITPESDNFGFARWVSDNELSLRETLGVGRHFGEWWGQGIQRGYGLQTKRFSLFNVGRWSGLSVSIGGIQVCSVPLLGTGPFTDGTINWTLEELRANGSHAVPGWKDPEGIVVFHKQSGLLFKVTLHNDEAPKGENQQ